MPGPGEWPGDTCFLGRRCQQGKSQFQVGGYAIVYGPNSATPTLTVAAQPVLTGLTGACRGSHSGMTPGLPLQAV